MSERILCAAVWYRHKMTYPHQPVNIKEGLVVTGLRHSHCFLFLSLMFSEQQYLKEKFNEERSCIQGFLTNTNRFVNREEAYILALEAKQMLFEHTTGTLFSEDLY